MKEALKLKSSEAIMLRNELHNMRPVRTQLAVATAVREKAGKLCVQVRSQIENLRGMLYATERELIAAEADFAQQAAAVATFTEQQAMEARRLAASGAGALGLPLSAPGSVGSAAPGTPAQDQIREAVSVSLQVLPPHASSAVASWAVNQAAAPFGSVAPGCPTGQITWS